MKTARILLIAPIFFAVLFLCTFGGVKAQSDWDITLRPAINFPTEGIADSKLSMGFGLGFGGAFSYKFTPQFSAVIGWGWNGFATDESFAGPKVDFTETGYSLGLRFTHPFILDSAYTLFIGVGAVAGHIEAENSEGLIIADSKFGMGWQIESGMNFGVGRHFVLSPGINYHALSRGITIDNTTTIVNFNYFSVGVGLSWAF